MTLRATVVYVTVLLLALGAFVVCFAAVVAVVMVAGRAITLLASMRDDRGDDMARIAELLGQAVDRSAQAVGSAAAAAMVPPDRQLTREELVANAAHDMAADFLGTDDVDDTDPTDAYIYRERTETATVDRDDPSPFGVPGLSFPPINGFDHVDVSGRQER